MLCETKLLVKWKWTTNANDVTYITQCNLVFYNIDDYNTGESVAHGDKKSYFFWVVTDVKMIYSFSKFCLMNLTEWSYIIVVNNIQRVRHWWIQMPHLFKHFCCCWENSFMIFVNVLQKIIRKKVRE